MFKDLYNQIMTTFNCIVAINGNDYTYDEDNTDMLKEVVLMYLLRFTSYSIINRNDLGIADDFTAFTGAIKNIIDKYYTKSILDMDMLELMYNDMVKRIRYMKNHGSNVELLDFPMEPSFESIKYIEHLKY